ncbi:MAG: DUF2802 domain-containing protein [Rhodanobacter sp.]
MLEAGIWLLLLLALGQSAALWLGWRQNRDGQEQLRQLQRDLDALTRSVAHASQTDVPTSMLVSALGRMERRIGLIEQQPSSGPQLTAYELAQQLARDGADVEQMVSRCGISRDEARLIRQMHPNGH